MPRDMTEKQFQDALKRNGFRPALSVLGYPYFEGENLPGTHYPGVVRMNGAIDRRATLARLICARDDYMTRQRSPELLKVGRETMSLYSFGRTIATAKKAGVGWSVWCRVPRIKPFIVPDDAPAAATRGRSSHYARAKNKHEAKHLMRQCLAAVNEHHNEG